MKFDSILASIKKNWLLDLALFIVVIPFIVMAIAEPLVFLTVVMWLVYFAAVVYLVWKFFDWLYTH